MTAPQAAPAPTGAPGHVRLATDGSTHHVAGDAAARADGSMIWLGRAGDGNVGGPATGCGSGGRCLRVVAVCIYAVAAC
jgi:hypothetical protein